MDKTTRDLFRQWRLLRLAVELTETQIEESCRERSRRYRDEYKLRRKELRQTLLATLPYRCAHCGTTEGKLSIDHIQPLAKGGRNALSNLQWLCLTCAGRKNNTLAEHWSWLRRRAYTGPESIPAVQIVLDTASQHAGEM